MIYLISIHVYLHAHVKVIAEANGSHVKEYPLVAERNWEVDVAALEVRKERRFKVNFIFCPMKNKFRAEIV